MSLKNLLLTTVGFVLLGIGAVGVFVPVLPTTPFVLTASACFTGNPRIRARLLRSAFFREHLDNYQRRSGLKKSTLFVSLGFLWATLCLSMTAIGKLWGVLLLCGVGVAVTAHLLCIARPKRADNHTASN